jgi:hypothetical protein
MTQQNDIQQNNIAKMIFSRMTQQNDIQHNDTHQNGLIHRSAYCYNFCTFVPNVVLPDVIMLNVIAPAK